MTACVSPELIDLAVVGAKAGLWEWDLASGRSRYTRSWQRLLGYGEEAANGSLEDWLDFLHPDDRERVVDYVLAYLTQPPSHYEIEFRVRHRDGTYRWIRSRAVATRDPQGQIERVLGVHFDITDRKQDEEVSDGLARVRQEIVGTLDSQILLQRLCVVAAEVLGCDWSHSWLLRPQSDSFVLKAAFGLSPEELEVARMVELSRAAIVEVAQGLSRDVVELGAGNSAQLPMPALLARGGATRALYIALRRGETLVGLQAVGYRGRREPFAPHQLRLAQGIVELASVALTNAQLMEELASANRLKSDFVATMSHELRTPLHIIMGYNGLLLEGAMGALNPEQEYALQQAQKSAKKQLDLINATLDLSRLERGEEVVELLDVDPHALLDEIKRETLALHRKPGVRLVWDVPPALPILHTDSAKVKVILKNLIDNGAKFTAAGTVTVRARSRRGGVELVVSDTGVGIAPELLPLLFEPFRQGEDEMTQQRGGVGLGLYVVRRLLLLLGGSIEVKSKLGHGSTFEVWIPASSARAFLSTPQPSSGAGSRR